MQRNENRRAKQRDLQQLRDQKAERLRTLYPPLIEFSSALQQVVREKSYILEGDSLDDRDARHNEVIRERMQRVGSIAAALIIEPRTSSVREAYQATYRACDIYLRSLSANIRVANTVSLETLSEQFEAISVAARELEANITEQMTSLEELV